MNDFARVSHALPAQCPPFCNGPRLVNPFASSARQVSLLYGVGARPPPDGV
jgi:hypothetical protein